MAQKADNQALETAVEVKKTRKAYKRSSPIQVGPKRGARLTPILHYLIDEDMTIAQLAEKCGLSRQGLSTRFVRDNCSLKDMEDMAAAAGYKFVWHWEKIKD